MAYLAIWVGALSLALTDPPVGSPSPRTDRAIAIKLDPGPYFVGQAIKLDLTVNRAGGDEWSGLVESPRIAQADLFEVKSGRSDSESASKPLARFFLVPRRAGNLTIPPFRWRSKADAAASKASTITVLNIPPGGRTRAFLGGVGSFRVSCQVEPKSVRVGQPVVFEIAMMGSAAVGSNVGPDLADWSKLSPAFQVRESSSQLDPTDPPTRTFRYRLRPTRPGQAVLPPLALAAFDPKSRSYSTRYTPSLTLTVESSPRFDPEQVDFGPGREATRVDLRGRVALGVTIASMIVGLGFLGVRWPIFKRWIERTRANRPTDWEREATRLVELTQSESEAAEVAEGVAIRFARAIGSTTKRPVAVLTPREAALAVLAITNDRDLSNEAERLVARLDEIRFDPDAQATVGDLSFVTEAVAVFRAIGRVGRPN